MTLLSITRDPAVAARGLREAMEAVADGRDGGGGTHLDSPL